MATKPKTPTDEQPTSGETAAPSDENRKPEDFKTEREKKGPDPVGEAVPIDGKPEPVKTSPGEPYPTGSPPDPEDQFEAAHGFRRAPKKE